MKLLVLGGAGAMAEHAMRPMRTAKQVSEMIIADRNEAGARQMAARLGGSCRALALDLTDQPALDAAMAEADLCFNMAGPYYRFGPLVLDAAIKARTHYFDICDDPEPTLDLLGRDHAVKEAGLFALIGMGASPGVSNMLAKLAMDRLAMDRLDEVERVYTGWGVASEGGAEVDGMSAALVHWFEQLSGTIPVFTNGAFVDEKPLKELQVRLPKMGEGPVWTCGHPEPLTLARNGKVTTESYNVMVLPPAFAPHLIALAGRIDSGELSVVEAAETLARGDVALPEDDGTITLPPLFALAQGGGRSVAAALLGGPDGGMGPITGIPCALAAQMFLDGKIGGQGCFAPEDVVPPELFFSRFKPYCKTNWRYLWKLTAVTEGAI